MPSMPAHADVPRPAISLARVLLPALAGWVLLNAAIIHLAHGYLPFDRPAVAHMPFFWQVAMPSLALVEQIALMALVWVMTRNRDHAARFARLPAMPQAARETIGLLAWAMVAQGVGWVIAPLFGFRPFSFHLAGTLFGCSVPPGPGEALAWAGYNFVAYAVLPYAWFAQTNDAAALWLTFDRPVGERSGGEHSGGKRSSGDWRVLVVVLVVESLVQVAANPAPLAMPARLWLSAAPLTFLLYLVGTVLPTMVLIYAILVPRYWRLTGSVAASTVLGGLTYAAMHLVEGWSSFTSPTNTLLSLLFVFATYTGPGMFKSYVTLRTGNAWVHALGYHAVAPHVLYDTPLVARIFAIG